MLLPVHGPQTQIWRVQAHKEQQGSAACLAAVNLQFVRARVGELLVRSLTVGCADRRVQVREYREYSSGRHCLLLHFGQNEGNGRI